MSAAAGRRLPISGACRRSAPRSASPWTTSRPSSGCVVHSDRTLSLAHEQSFLRNVGRKAIKRTQKKPRRKPVAEAIIHAADIAPMPDDLPSAPRCRSLRKGPCSPMEITRSSAALGNDRAIDQALADGRGTHAPGGLSLWRPVILPVVAADSRFLHLSPASRILAPRELASCESVTCSVVS